MKSKQGYYRYTTITNRLVLFGILTSLSLWSFWASYQAALLTDKNNKRALLNHDDATTNTITNWTIHAPTIPNSIIIRPDVPSKELANNNNNNANNTTTNETTLLTVSKTDIIMRQSPFVLEEYKLIFFPVTKVACTAFKILLRRMQGFDDWKTAKDGIHSTKKSGLKTLKLFSEQQALDMMTAPDWTRAIFVRDPKERLLSAYLDKAVKNSWYVQGRCCGGKNKTRTDINLCMNKATKSLQGFLATIQTCLDIHWVPQTYRMDKKYWKYINFVGHMENGPADAKILLQKLGVWEEFGASGWGSYGNLTFLDPAESAGRDHATNAVELMKLHYTTPAVEREAEAYYKIDYDNPYLGLSRKHIFVD